MLNLGFTEVLNQYNDCRKSQPGIDQNASVYKIIHTSIPKYLEEQLNNEKYQVTGSVGVGRWAEVPWIGIFNKEITTSAQKGFYICYLFGNDMNSIYLTIIHSITKEGSTKNWDKDSIALFVQSKRENLIANVSSLSKFTEEGIKIENPISFGKSSRAQKYSESTIAYKEYSKQNLPDEEILLKDFKLFVELYEQMETVEKNNTSIAEGDDIMVELENVVLIKINKSYKENMTPEELYRATSVSWVASFEKTEKRDLKYYCSVYKNKIIEVYELLSTEEEMPRRNPPRFILHGRVANEDIRQRLLGIDVSTIHKGLGNPIKYTNLDVLLNLNNEQPINAINDVEIIREEKVEYSQIKSQQLLSHIHTYITAKGFNYSKQNITNLYLSIRSKPFVIISGISGTGKTKIVQLFAESIGATEENGQFMLVPVRPDWSDGSELLGYTDIKGDFMEGQLTKLLRHAIEYPERPHFLLLDEMNLARVEYYFSDILSVMESRSFDGFNLTSSKLQLSDDVSVHLPGNVYIIGTVNMDETTHPFSKKVLDRANTIEFNEIELNNFSFLHQHEVVEQLLVANSSLQANYIQLQSMYTQHAALVHDVSQQLTTINEYLKEVHAQVGYRVRDEICFYMAHNVEGGMLLSEDEAFDFCLMQKISPRIAGSGTRIEQLLKELQNFMENRALPRSKQKLAQMQRRLSEDEFTSFWIA